jgi:CheY-like chemotaxis protein/Ran GTPase-activating protein (RanGAP) involved in mRNA processing and transport
VIGKRNCLLTVHTCLLISYDAVYEEDLPGLLAVKTHFWDKGHPDVEVFLRRRTIEGDWIWLKTKAVSYVDQPIPGIILIESYVDDEHFAYQLNRITRITAILVQAVEAAQVASMNANDPNMDSGSNSDSEPMENSKIPWVTDDAAAYQAMVQNTDSATEVNATMDDPLEHIMRAAALGGATGPNKSLAASKLEQEIMERVGGKKKEAFDPFSVMEEVREGVRLDLGMTRLSRAETKMITLVLTGRLAVEDLTPLVFHALSSGQGLEDALQYFHVETEKVRTYSRENGLLGMPQQNPTPHPPPISVVNLSYTYMGNTAIEMFGEVLFMEKSLLRTIDISFCGLEERGCLALARALTKRKRSGIAPLRGIILSGNHISFRAATDLGRALSPDQNKERIRKRVGSRVKSGGYDEDSESDDDEFDGDNSESFAPGSRQGSRGSESTANANAEKYYSRDHGLQVLHLGAAMPDAESTAQFLHGLGPMCPVRELSLTSNNLGPNGAKLVVDFLEGKGMSKKKQVMPFLDRLDLSNNNLGNEGLTKLTRAITKRSVMHLVELRLSNNGIGFKGIETIMNKLLQHNLISLSLDKNSIGDQGCQLVAASLQSMKALSRLNLGFNQIGSRGVNSLMRSIVAAESIVYLSLSGNIMKISGAVAMAFTLAQHPRLEELALDNCCLSQAAQCHIVAGVISNRWVPMKRMNGFEAGPPMVALGALKMVAQSLSNEECFRLRKDEQMKTILQWMESNRVAKMSGKDRSMHGGTSDSYEHFLTPDFVQSMNDVHGIPSQNAYLRLLGWLSRIPFDEDELISLRKYFYDADGGSEDRGSDGYINLKLRGDLLAALESDVADEIRDDSPLLVQYAGSVGMDIDAMDGQGEVGVAWDYMKGARFDKTQRLFVADSSQDHPADERFQYLRNSSNGTDSDQEMTGAKKRRMSSAEFRADEQRGGDDPMTDIGQSARSSVSTNMSRQSVKSLQHSGSERSTTSQGERRRGTGLKSRITMFPQFETKLEELKATATDMIEQEEDPEQQEVILTQYAEASLTILRQLRYHCMNSGLDGWRQGSTKRKVLIVDDSTVTRKLVSRAFEKANFIVDTASNGAEGVEKLKKSIYDIAFMDIDMPVMNGFEATKMLREWEDAVRPGTRQPICALTAAYVDDFERSELMKFKEAGLDVMESKPCNIPRLFKVVDDVSPMFSDLSISVIQQERGGV